MIYILQGSSYLASCHIVLCFSQTNPQSLFALSKEGNCNRQSNKIAWFSEIGSGQILRNVWQISLLFGTFRNYMSQDNAKMYEFDSIKRVIDFLKERFK